MTAAGATGGRVRTLIVEDQRLFRVFLTDWFSRQPRFEVVGAAASAEEGLRLARELEPNLLLVDLHLPGMDGLDLVRAVRQTRPEVNSLILTSLTDPLAVARIRESGVEGYLEKDADPDELSEAVHTVAAGRSYFSRRFRDLLVREGRKPAAMGKILSRREQQVMFYVLDRKSNKEIADLMKLSARTVEFHRANLMAKLEATNIQELMDAARRHGWD